MALDRGTKGNLIKRIIKQSQIEEDASRPDAERLKARERKEFYNNVLNRLNRNQSTDSNQ